MYEKATVNSSARGILRWKVTVTRPLTVCQLESRDFHNGHLPLRGLPTLYWPSLGAIQCKFNPNPAYFIAEQGAQLIEEIADDPFIIKVSTPLAAFA